MKTPSAKTSKSSEATTALKRELQGVVTSDKMKDTIVVKVDRFVKHPKYGKFQKLSKKFKAHDAGNTKKIGDIVTIVESRPISKDKHFIVK